MAYESDFYIARNEKEDVKEINEEFVLPDYLPEVKKILTCRDSISLPSVYRDGDTVVADGNMKLNVLYLGNDGKIYSAPFERDYSFSFSDHGERRFASEIVKINTEGFLPRALSPRKIAVRGKLLALMAVQSASDEEECITEELAPASCEYLCKNIEYADVKMSEPEVFEIADEVVNDLGNNSLRIISCESTALVSEAVVVDEKVTVRGEITTDILICDDALEEEPRQIRRKTQFAHTLSDISASSEQKVCASVRCTLSEAKIEANTILLNIYCSIRAFLSALKKKKVCVDMYSPTNHTTLQENVFDNYIPALCSNKNISINCALSASETGIESDRKLICAFADAICDGISVGEESKRESVNGRVIFKILTVNDSNEEKDYDCKEVSVPFKYDISSELQNSFPKESHFLFANAEPSRILSRFDGERLGLDAELSLCLLSLGKNKNSAVSGITVGEKIEKEKGCLRIVYPNKGESLWNIAKRTYSKTDDIRSNNEVMKDAEKDSPDSLEDVKYVIV